MLNFVAWLKEEPKRAMQLTDKISDFVHLIVKLAMTFFPS